MTTSRTARRLPPVVACSLLVVLPGAALAQVATGPAVPPGQGPGDPPAALQEGRYDDGRLLYSSSCAGCHGQTGEGSSRGPTLVGVGEASVDFQLTTGRMPLVEERSSPDRGDPAFAPSDIDALVRYVSALAAGSGPDIPEVHPGALAEGRELYLLNCAACHSATGTGYAQVGGRVAPELFAADPVQIAEAVRVGPGLMPQFPDGVLDQEELDSVVTYVQELQRVDGRGGADLERLGPVAETLAGFAGLALLLVVIRRLGKAAP